MSQPGPSAPPALSRLHLAAALIEYDNDDEEAPPDRYKSHRDSAMFRDLQRYQQDQRYSQPPRLPHASTHENDHGLARPPSLVAAPGPARMRDSATMEILEGRHGRSFSGSREGPPQTEIEPEVDVSRWGLPDHLISTVPAPATSGSVPAPGPASRPVSATPSALARPAGRPFPLGPGHAPLDMNAMDGVEAEDAYGIASALESAERVRRLAGLHPRNGAEGEGERERTRTRSGGDIGLRPARGDRRVSFNELDLNTTRERPSTSMGLMPTSPRSARSISRSPLNPVMIPLPTSPTRSRQSSYLAPIPRVAEDDPYSAGRGRGEEEALREEDEEEQGPNPFAMPAPPPELGSRFDPKQLASQRSHSALSAQTASAQQQQRQRPVSEMRPSSMAAYRHSSYTVVDDVPDEQDIADLQHDPQVYDEIPTAEQYGKPLRAPKYTQNRPQRMSRHDLLRPKTLIMPSMLADIPPPASPPKKKWQIAPEGFSIGDKPLPAGARTSALNIGGVARLPLSLSQRTFRSSLMVGGQRGEAWVGGAEVDGEVAVGKKERDDLEEELRERKPGKLYGKSLIDQLEARKHAMKSKQRQFAGDSRPAMMARHSMVAGPSTSPTARRGPLLQFDENGNVYESPTKPEHPDNPSQQQAGADNSHMSLAPPSRPTDRLTKSTSVFGVDEIWEKEMAKLRIIQANEAEQRRQEEEKERIKQEKKDAKEKDKGKKSKKGKERAVEAEYAPVALDEHDALPTEDEFSPIKKVDDLPPMLHFSPEKPPPRLVAIPDEPAPAAPKQDSASSDSEEDVPLSRIRRTTSVHSSKTAPPPVPVPEPESSDDEEGNVPLSRLRKPKPQATGQSASPVKPVLALDTDFGPGPSHPSEDLQTTGSLGLSLPSAAREKALQDLTQPTVTQPTGGEDDDDDVPLLLRQAHIKATSPTNDDDDDVPLGMRQSMRQSSFNFQPPHPASFMPPPQHAPQPQFYQHPQYAQSMMSMSMYGFPPPQPPVWGGGYPASPASGYPFPPMPQHHPIGPAMPMGMTMPPLPQFAMMTSPAGQHDNIDNWRKGVAPPSVSGESRG